MQVIDVVRILTAIFLVPHMLLKLPRIATLHKFYERARLPFPRLLSQLGLAVEILVVISLLTGFALRYGAALGVLFLLGASAATVRLNGWGKWRWEQGGPEYPLYLATMLVTVAIYA
jgi:uncharacterized membrane protein YphA (DoxX/SURF4 family)